MNATICRQLAARNRRILRRIENQPGVDRQQPMMTAPNTHYEISDRTPAIAPGGLGAIHLMAQKLGLVQDIKVGELMSDRDRGGRNRVVMIRVGEGADSAEVVGCQSNRLTLRLFQD